MQRWCKSLFLAVLLGGSLVHGGEVYAEDKVIIRSEEFDYTVTLDDNRFTNDDSNTDVNQEWTYAEDDTNVATIMITGFHKDPSIGTMKSVDEWAQSEMEGIKDKKRGKWYNSGYGAREDVSKRVEYTATLGSGEIAKCYGMLLTINNNKRHFTICGFERVVGDKSDWFLVDVYNVKKTAEHRADVEMILKGISYTE